MEKEKNNRKESGRRDKKEEKRKSFATRRLWVKWIALILAMAGMLGCIFFGICVVAFGTATELRSKPEDIQKAINEKLLRGYVGVLFCERGNDVDFSMEEGWDGLNGGNIRYTITKGENEGKEVIYSNDDTVSANNCDISFDFDRRTMVSGSYADNFWDIFFADYDVHYRNGEVNAGQLEKVYYVKDTGLFYAGTEDLYYLIEKFEFLSDEETVFYTLENGDKGSRYVSGEDGSPLGKMKDTWLEDEDVAIMCDALNAGFAGENHDLIIKCVETFPKDQVSTASLCYLSEIQDDSDGTNTWYVYTTEETTVQQYHIYASVSDSVREGAALNNGYGDYFPEAEALCDSVIWLRKVSGGMLVLCLIVFVAAFVYLMKAAGHRPEDDMIHLRVFDQIPFGLLTILVGYAEAGVILIGVSVINYLEYHYISFFLTVAGVIAAACVCSLVALGYCMSIASRIKAKKFWRYTVIYYLLKPFKWMVKMGREKVSLFAKVGLLEFAITFIELLIICTGETDVILLCFFLFKLVEIPSLICVMYQLYLIREGGRRVAGGNYSQPIDTRRMIWEFKKHAENINNVGIGISFAVEEKMKSERFKTELITNVSHDIKTPLTSIINYIDLIKKEEIENPTVQEYIGILDHQSARLKKLIEDLMEASKASTGNLPVHLEICDATVMLTQVIGEFQERAQTNGLEIVVESPDPPVHIMADGRHLWRIIDNLMSNICKYAQTGTRVYINLEQFNGMVIMTFRNISRERLNISSEELMGRFVRGDSSRNTEGNGLGLSIAKSLTELMDGNLAIQIDGDLFKVILSFSEC